MNINNLEPRKLKEIEHSKTRREVLQGFERLVDTHAAQSIGDLNELIKDKEKFNYYFSNMKFYSVTKSSEDYKHNWLRTNIKKGSEVLDFACGSGENGIFSAKCGARVYGIDISPEGIENARANSVREGVADLCTFEVMDGEAMTFSDNSFDLAVEYGALHHVDLDKALSELSRVLKPKAAMICVEALRHNPLIHAYRKRTPHLRTEWEVEHILGVESLQLMKKYFKTVNVRFFHLTSLALVPIRKTAIFKYLYPLFDSVDKLILKVPFIGKYGWIMIIEIADPKK